MISIAKLLLGIIHINFMVAQRCSNIITRREIRDISGAERRRFFNAVKKLHSGNDNFEGYTEWHIQYDEIAHRNSAFLPWHRKFIHNYERSLRKIDPSVVLPYWDWTRDSQAPEESIIFSNEYFGGNGRRGDHCVVDGAFANWRSSIPNRHCLRRDFKDGSTIPPLSSPEVIEAIISKTSNYDEFRRLLEYPSHGIVHNNVGGRYGDFSKMHSTNDPIFYLHHAFVDLIWNEWQLRNPSMATTYNGGRSSSNDALPPFNTRVHNVLRTTDLCYTYPRFIVEMPEVMDESSPEDSIEPSLEDDEVENSIVFSDESPVQSQDKVNPNATEPNFDKLDSFIDQLDNVPKLRALPIKSRFGKSTRGRKIRPTEPLSEQFIRDNKLNREEVRANERLMAKLVQSLNSIPQFETSAGEPVKKVTPDTIY